MGMSGHYSANHLGFFVPRFEIWLLPTLVLEIYKRGSERGSGEWRVNPSSRNTMTSWLGGRGREPVGQAGLLEGSAPPSLEKLIQSMTSRNHDTSHLETQVST